MNEFDEKSQTFEFAPIKEEKPQQNRSANDEFSTARKGYGDYRQPPSRKKKKAKSGLIIATCIQTVVMVVVVACGIFFFKNSNTSNLPAEKEIAPVTTEKALPKATNKSVLCNIVFYSDSVKEDGEKYKILADLYDEEMEKFDSKKLIIDSETDIRKDGVRITPQAFFYLLENINGESIAFEGEVRSDDDVVLSISFESFEEETKTTQPSLEHKTMYANCDTHLSFRNGPGTEYPKMFDLSPGEAVIYMGQEENGFAKVNYDGTVGYVSADYLSDVRPYVWWYNADEVEYFVEEVLYAYVNAINFDDVSVLTKHLKGKAVTDAINTHNMIRKSVYEEKILSVNCYGAERISKTRVNVTRESTIRVYKKDGTYRDAVEKYITTVENTGDGMYVVGYTAVK